MRSGGSIFIDYLGFGADGSVTVTRPAPDGNRIWITSRPGGRRRATWRTGDVYGSRAQSVRARWEGLRWA